ncbi:YfcC family protein [Bacillus sp. 3103sda1]|uniref:YfcC family protein n=1 Tax=Bacillus sp. 3103sda1 TaxID=2953808 RepID=UPI0020A11928|nr:Na+/H+ antiporter NhaC family protein [Bacillus sp. 3103sda1]MCP1124659.1 YfcC family protein [Bacillus sp. 3103sda1]
MQSIRKEIAVEKTAGQEKAERKRKFLQPDAYVLLFFVALICAIATYILPAGQFAKIKKGDISMTVPGSYHHVASNPTGFVDFFTTIQNGMVKGAPIIFLILFTSGALAIIEKSGAIDAFLKSTLIRLRNRLLFLIIPVGLIFSVLGTTGIITNAVIAFIPLGLLVARELKLDPIFGVALIYLGTYAGWNVPVFAPQTLGLSQRIAHLPLFSGMGYRVIIYLAFLAATIIYIYMYARKIRKDPNKSILGPESFASEIAEKGDEVATTVTVSLQQKLILSFAGLSLLGFIIFSQVFKWTENEMAGLFIFIAIGVGLIARMSANDIAFTFIQGCKQMVYGALIVGMARAVGIILEDARILDTIVNVLTKLLEPLSPIAGSIGMFVGSAALHFLISSGSGESTVLMPILVPLADLLHITRQVTVQAVMLGEGVVNTINPTSGVLMGVLAMSGISYGKWLKFMLPLTAVWFVLSCIFIIIGMMINWGPF